MIIKKKITTLTTNANGRATYQYDSAGVGDIIFSANFKGDDGSLSTEIYVQDCTKYITSELTQKGSTGDHSNILGTDLNLILPNKFELEYKFKLPAGFRINLCKNTNVTNNPEYSIFFENASNGTLGYGVRTTSTDGTTTDITPTGDYYTVKIIRDGTTLTYYLNEVLCGTRTVSWIDNYNYTFYWSYWRTGTGYVKEIKIKPL